MAAQRTERMPCDATTLARSQGAIQNDSAQSDNATLNLDSLGGSHKTEKRLHFSSIFVFVACVMHCVLGCIVCCWIVCGCCCCTVCCRCCVVVVAAVALLLLFQTRLMTVYDHIFTWASACALTQGLNSEGGRNTPNRHTHCQARIDVEITLNPNNHIKIHTMNPFPRRRIAHPPPRHAELCTPALNFFFMQFLFVFFFFSFFLSFLGCSESNFFGLNFLTISFS